MTKRITLTILAVVLGSTLIVGFGTTLLSFRSNRQQTRSDVASLTRNLADLARFSRTVPLGVSQDCDAIRRPARKRACETWLANTAGAAAEMVADRERLRLGFELEGIAFISYDLKADTVLDESGNTTDTAALPEPLTVSDIPLGELAAGGSVDGVTGNVAFAAMGTVLEQRPNQAIIVVATRRFEPFFGPTTRWFLVSASVALAAAALVSWRLGSKLGAPVHAATVVSQAIAAGDLSARIPATPSSGVSPRSSTDELTRLATSINSMADSLERSKGLEQQFLMSVSHDLRTPLTNIGGWAEAIADGAANPPQAAEVIQRETHRLRRLVEDLLDLAKLNANEFRYRLGLFELAELAETALAGFEREARSAGVALRLATPPKGTQATSVNVDPDRMQQVLGNLIGNALKYARSAVSVAVAGSEGRVWVAVADDGPGIAADDLPHVFERLYMAGAIPARKELGSGLGLAIVDQLVRGMNGEVTVTSDGHTGTTMTVSLPSAPTTPPSGPQRSPTPAPAPAVEL